MMTNNNYTLHNDASVEIEESEVRKVIHPEYEEDDDWDDDDDDD